MKSFKHDNKFEHTKENKIHVSTTYYILFCRIIISKALEDYLVACLFARKRLGRDCRRNKTCMNELRIRNENSGGKENIRTKLR